jgi:hypothetical protein
MPQKRVQPVRPQAGDAGGRVGFKLSVGRHARPILGLGHEAQKRQDRRPGAVAASKRADHRDEVAIVAGQHRSPRKLGAFNRREPGAHDGREPAPCVPVGQRKAIAQVAGDGRMSQLDQPPETGRGATKLWRLTVSDPFAGVRPCR